MIKGELKSSHAGHGDGCGCHKSSDCNGLVRNEFHAGKRISATTLKVEQDYAASKRRLINASVLGWGIVYGFDLHIGKDRRNLHVSAGLAIDRRGNEVFLPDDLALRPSDVVLHDVDGKPVKAGSSIENGEYILSVHYAERYMDPVYLTDDCGNERRHWERTCDGVVFSLRPTGGKAQHNPEACGLDCTCSSTIMVDDDHVEPPPPPPPPPPPSEVRGASEQYHAAIKRERKVEEILVDEHWKPRGGTCLCNHLAELTINSENSCLSGINECLHYALRDGVVLGIVVVDEDECGHAFLAIREKCSVRHHVKRNDLLFDLIKGCDLTHIAGVGWKNYHRNKRSMPYQTLLDSLSSPASTDLMTFAFSKPVLCESMLPDVFVLRIWLEEYDSGWLECFEAKLDGLHPMDPHGGYASTFRPVFSQAWIDDEIKSKKSKFNGDNVRIEIEIRGDYIIDCNGQCVDANPRGLMAAPTGNGTPGGTYLSTFMLEPSPRSDNRKDSSKGGEK